MYPTGKNQVERDVGFEVARVLVHPFQSRHQGISHLKRQSRSPDLSPLGYILYILLKDIDYKYLARDISIMVDSNFLPKIQRQSVYENVQCYMETV